MYHHINKTKSSVSSLLRISFTCLFTGVFCITLAQTSTYTSVNNGSWGAATTWACVGVCSATTPTSSANDAVVINHSVTSIASVAAYSITIENAINDASQHAWLAVSGTGGLTVGTGGMMLNSVNDNGGNTQFSITGSGVVAIGGNVSIIQNKNSGAFTKFRVGGGGAASTVSVTVNGDLILSYLNSSISTSESEPELSLGSIDDDDVTFTVNGNTTLTYDFANTVVNNSLGISVWNYSEAIFNGDFTMTMEGIDGATNAVARLSLYNNAVVTITGTTSLNYEDNHGGTDLIVEVEDDARLSLADLTLSSSFNTTTINNTVRVSNQSQLLINGNITFTHNGTGSTPSQQNRITANHDSTIEMKGNIIDHEGNISNGASGSFDYASPGVTAKFSGTAAQIIPSNLRPTTTYQNIEIDNEAGVSLSANTTVAGTVLFTDGILSTSSPSNQLTLTDNGTTSGGSATSYIDGPVRKTCPTGVCGNTLFVVGDGSFWAPLAIDDIQGEGSTTVFTVQYQNFGYGTTTTDGTFDHVSAAEHWLVSVNGTVPTADVTFHWKDACLSQIEDVTTGSSQTLFIGAFGGSEWSKSVSTIIGDACDPDTGTPEVGYITVENISPVGPFTFISQTAFDNPLPVELVNFEVSKDTWNRVTVLWETASEIHNDFFSVERSSDMKIWTSIDRVAGQGTTNQKTNYSIIDPNPLVGSSYYRLKQCDFDGSYHYSEIKKMIISTSEVPFRLDVYPNPVNPEMHELILESNHVLRNISITIVGINGLRRKEIILDDIHTRIQIAVSDMEDGFYLLKFNAQETVYFKKILVQRK